MDNNIELRFIGDTLRDEAQRLLKNQALAMTKELKFHTSDIIDERKAEVKNTGPVNATLELAFTPYTRQLDIKKERNGKLKSYRIYNRFVWGHYYAIAYRLMYDLTDEVRNNIRASFNTP